MSIKDLSDEALLAALGETLDSPEAAPHTAREERILAGFGEIQRFVARHGRVPNHDESGDIFERLYAIRLDRLRALPEARTLLAGMDAQGLLDPETKITPAASLDDAALLEALGAQEAEDDDITILRHVRPAEIQVSEEIASRTPCPDFAQFKPLFEETQKEWEAGLRKALPFGGQAKIETGDFFILGGLLVYVAETGENFKAPNGKNDARLRVIYANGTQSNLLRRSLQRALNKDEAGRRLIVVPGNDGPLFSGEMEEGDIESGTIYVLRSFSKNPAIAAHRELIHKIGVTGGKVETRIAQAENDATYLLAAVEVVATYKLAGIRRSKLEHLLHRVFAPAQLDLTIQDRFGKDVSPREWFLVPLPVIDEAIKRIIDGSIANMAYNPETARLEQE
ncbi:MAG: GIY-YIG nuclease family protein [Zoogloeaceae bacterium]|jgi:hypothetical protein|nr:GIY-YIG nuclease family protein [Zoogloeaceae bacterium]